MSCFLPNILERHLPLFAHQPTCPHFTAVQAYLSQPNALCWICENQRNGLNKRRLLPVYGGKGCERLRTLQLPLGLRRSNSDICRTPGSTEVAALALLLESGGGEYVRLGGMVQDKEMLCGTTSSTAGLPISLVTCGWSNSFIHAASRRNSSMSVEVKMSAGKKASVSFPPLWVAPRDFTDNDYQKLVLCGTAHPLSPTARRVSLQQSRA